MWLKTYLIITGIGAFVALAMPGVMVIASFLIIPGVILAVMPTAFMYGIVFAVVQLLLGHIVSGLLLHLLSVAATYALLWYLPQPGLVAARVRLEAVTQPAVRPEARLALSGDILITRPFGSQCNAVCAALLKMSGVTSVRVVTPHSGSTTYRLGESAVPGKRAAAIGFGLLEDNRPIPGDPLGKQRALEAEWNAIMSNGRPLVASDDAPAPKFTISIEDGPILEEGARRPERVDWSFKPSTPHRQAVVITDNAGNVLLRHSLVSISAVKAPLSIGMGGGIHNFHFGWQRTRLGARRLDVDVPVDRLLLEHTDIARGVNVEAAAARARDGITRALNDPSKPADDPAFALANQWMDSFTADRTPLSADDRRLLNHIVGDPRVRSCDGLGAIVARIEGSAEDLRRLAARRYLAAGGNGAERCWVNGVASLPEGAFAEQLPEEADILADPERSRYATGLIVRQRDRGAAAIPDLLRLMRGYSVCDPGKRGYSNLSEAISAVRRGFRGIGPVAASARTEIETLLATPALKRRYDGDRMAWDTLLVILGRPVETLDKPQNLSGTTAGYRQRLAELAARPYDPRGID